MSQVSYGTITITDITDIDNVQNYYLATSASSGVTTSTSGWTTAIQNMTSTKQYLWNYEQILGTGGVVISTTTPVIIGRYGQNGQDGVSITSIDEYYKASSSDSTIPSTWNTVNVIDKPTATNKYLWNYQVIHYSNNTTEGSAAEARIIGVYGDKGDKGDPGTAGINTATVYLYQRATSAPSVPSGNLTYTFSTGVLSGTLGNWKQSIGELTGTNPIWVTAAVANSNGTTDIIVNSDWSTVIKLAQNGTDGLNQATVYIYKRATSATAPSSTTYTFSTGAFTVPTGWSKTVPASDGNPCYVTSAIAIGSSSTATLTWVTPSVLVEDGTDGFSPTVTATTNGVIITDKDGNQTTITNGTNGVSYYTHIRYSASSNGANMVSTPTSSTIYMGVYTGTSSTAPTTASSYTWSKYMGVDGVSVTQVTPIYYLKTSSGSVPTAPAAGTAITSTSTGAGVWTTAIPDYVSGGTYYTCTQTYLSSGTSPISSTAIQDKALTNSNSTALNALNVAQGVNNHFWWITTDETHGSNTFVSGAYITQVTDDSFLANPTNEGNLLLRSGGIYLNNGLLTLASFEPTALTFNRPSTSIKGMQLTSSGLSFYDSTGTIAQATFGGTQATISGTINVYDGHIGNSSDSYWYIGNYLDYQQNISAAIKSHGTAFIQLGDSSTWRVATNRIHTAWNDDSSSGNAFRLHFPIYNDKNSASKYWDLGLHLPTSRTDKFLYIRNAASTQTLENLGNDLEDSGYGYWTYQFYIDGEGNVHAPGFYVGESTTPIGGGANTIAQKIINSDGITYGKGSTTQPIYIDSNGYVQTISYTIAKSVPSDAEFTDTKNTAGSTDTSNKLFLIGATSQAANPQTYSNSGTYAQSDKLYSNSKEVVNLSDTQALTNKTYNGYTLAAASAKGVDTSITASSTSTNLPTSAAVAALINQYLPLTGGSITGAVTFGDSVSIDELTVGDVIVNGSASFTNNIQANTINGVSVGSNPKFTDNNTTYTFTNGINGFTVTPSDGSAQTVTVTPSITNNVTGTGTSGSLAKWNGAHTLTDGPAFSSGGTGFLKEDGTWGTPGGTYSLPTAKYNTLGGVKPAYSSTNAATLTTAAAANTTTPTIAAKSTTSGRYYAVEIDKNGVLFVNVPWTNVNSSYLTSESDPVFSSSAAAGITSTDISNWNAKTSNTGTVTSVAASGSGGISISGSPVTTNGTISIGLNLSTAINGLEESASPAQRDDYIVAQYAGGGTTTTTYHRRKLSNIFAALNASDITTALGFTPTDNTGTVTSVKVQGSNGLTGSGTITTSGTITISHATGSGSSSSNSGRTYIQSVTLDGYGHVTGLTTATETVTDTHHSAYIYATTSTGTANTTSVQTDPYLTLVENGSARSRVQLKAGTNVTSISANAGVITFNVKDTTYTAATAAPGKVASASSQGSSTNYARQDHTHGIDLATGDANGQVKIAGTNVSVKGLGSWAYKSSGTGSDVGLGNVSNYAQITKIGDSGDGKLRVWTGDPDGTGYTDVTVHITAYDQSTVSKAEALNLSAAVGATNKPVYFKADGKPYAIDYTIEKSVPSDAVFTDTTYTFDGTYNASSNKAATVSTVTNAINNLDVNAITGTAGQTITSISETNGKISATYSNISITKSQISDFPNSMTPTAHNHSQIVTVGDQRSTATTPNSYSNALIFQGLKSKATIGNPSSDTYSYLVGLRGWSDNSGGYSHEIAFNNTGIFVRRESASTANTWGNWEQIYTSGNLTKTIITNLGVPAQDTTYTFDGTYNASTNKAATVSTVTNAIGALDGTITGTAGAGKTLTAFSQTDGKVTATFGNISITKSQISDFPSEMTPAAHSHTLSIATDTSTTATNITLAHATKYKLTAGGSTYLFTTPSDTDEKLKIGAVTSGTTYYPIVGANSTAAANRQYDATGFSYAGTNGTANGSNGNALLILGNNTASTTANWKKGTVRLYGTTAYYVNIVSGAPTANRTITLPNATGTVALTSDLAWGTITGKPTATGSATTGISIANHSTTSITGVSGSTTASYVTVSSHSTDYGVTSVGGFTQGVDSFTANTPTVINTAKFNGGSYSHSGFSGGSFTRGAFTQGTLPTLTMSVSGSELTISFGQGTLPTHAADSFTAATYGTDNFTGASFQSGFYTAGTPASFTQGTDSFTAPSLGSKISVVNADDITVPVAASAVTVVTGKTHTITDNGHTHTI